MEVLEEVLWGKSRMFEEGNDKINGNGADTNYKMFSELNVITTAALYNLTLLPKIARKSSSPALRL